MKRIFSLIVLMLSLAMVAFADIRIPDRPNPTPTATPPTVEKEAETIAENAILGIGSAQTIVGGLFLSFAFVFGGIRLARRKMRMPRASAGVLIAE
jgi:hypothetical protein